MGATKKCSNSEIITSVTKDSKEEVIAILPKYKSLNDKITKEKNKHLKNFNPQFDDIPNFLKIDLNLQQFLQYDKGVESDNRFIIFFSENNRKYINTVETVLIDGTFWSCPSNFEQMITFNCRLFGNFYPLCFILLSSKREDDYKEAFGKLKELVECNFKEIIIDFEKGLGNAVSFIFKNVSVFGCSFHYGQCCWRQLQKVGLSSDYMNNKDLNELIRMFIDLSFIPVFDVREKFEILKLKALGYKNKRLNDFVEYYFDNFVGSDVCSPRFDLKFINCHYRILNNIPRTTNGLEGWHRSLNFKCNIPHLNLGKFIEVLKEETEIVRIKIIQAINSIDLGKRDLKKEEKLRCIIESYKLYKNDEFFLVIRKVIGWKFE